MLQQWNDPIAYIRELAYLLPALIVCFTAHEFAHAITAVWLGDPTPRNMGRITLNPLKHIDPMGFIMMIIVGFGWAKPVQINPRNMQKPRRDNVIVSLAGVTVNLAMALIFFLLYMLLLVVAPGAPEWLFYAADSFYGVSVMLGIFNLLPMPPLDGSHLLRIAFGRRGDAVFAALSRFGIFALMALSISGVLGRILDFFSGLVMGYYSTVYFFIINMISGVLG